MIRQYEADKNPQKTINLLKAIQWTRVAWEQGVTSKTIKKCWIRSTLIQPVEELIVEEDDQATDRAELQAQIAQLPIGNPLPINEAILDEDKDIFESVVDHHSIDKLGEESESSDEEEEEEVDTREALKCVEKLKLWKLQKGNEENLQAFDRIEREIVRYKSSTTIQTMIHRISSHFLEIRIPLL
jgi:hypothetical protein